MPRKQDFNPKIAIKPESPAVSVDRTGWTEENIRRARLRSETMIFTPDEIVMAGEFDMYNFLFSADNPDKFCCMRKELPYLIEQGFLTALPYTRQMIDNLKVNWAKDLDLDLYNFPGADEYWDELKIYQDEQTKQRNDRYGKINSIAEKIAGLPLFPDAALNYELFIIALIAARESDPKACIKGAKNIIFEIAREQYSLQTTEDKKNDNRSRKLGPKKRPA